MPTPKPKPQAPWVQSSPTNYRLYYGVLPQVAVKIDSMIPDGESIHAVIDAGVYMLAALGPDAQREAILAAGSARRVMRQGKTRKTRKRAAKRTAKPTTTAPETTP